MLCFNFMVDVGSAYQSIVALHGAWDGSGSTLPLREGTGSGLAIQIAKSGFFYAKVKNVLLSCASLPSCFVHTHTPRPPTLADLAQKSEEITVLLSNSSVQRSALACSTQADFSPQEQANPPTHEFFSGYVIFKPSGQR